MTELRSGVETDIGIASLNLGAPSSSQLDIRNAIVYNTRNVKEGSCRVCGKKFQAERRTALYCSDACRQRAFRIRGGRVVKAVKREVTQIGDVVEWRGDQYTVAAPCEDGRNGRWVCLTHQESFLNNLSAWGHEDDGKKHQMVWWCGEHGPEA